MQPQQPQLLLKTMLNNITAIKARHQGKWFDPGALAWFNSTFPARTVYPVPDGAYFISREYSKGVYISTGWIPDGPVGGRCASAAMRTVR